MAKICKNWRNFGVRAAMEKAQVSFGVFSLTLRLKGNYSTLPQQLSQCFRDRSLSFRDRNFPNRASASISFEALLPRPQCEDYLEIYRSKCPSKYKIKSSFCNLPRREPFREASAAFRGLNPVHFSKITFHRKHTDITEGKKTKLRS